MEIIYNLSLGKETNINITINIPSPHIYKVVFC